MGKGSSLCRISLFSLQQIITLPFLVTTEPSIHTLKIRPNQTGLHIYKSSSEIFNVVTAYITSILLKKTLWRILPKTKNTLCWKRRISFDCAHWLQPDEFMNESVEHNCLSWSVQRMDPTTKEVPSSAACLPAHWVHKGSHEDEPILMCLVASVEEETLRALR